MNWFKKRPPILTTEPYAFELGKHYVIEVKYISDEEIAYLSDWFEKHGINVALIITHGPDRCLLPVEATTTTNVDPDRSKMTPPKKQDQ